MARRIRIRMYRTGFGDCFLVSVGPVATVRHLLIDFGVHQKGDIGKMAEVMANIETVTKKRLDVVVASHAHRDHISGFGEFGQRFEKFDIGEVWLPWTDNPDDKDVSALERRHLALYEALDRHLAAVPAAKKDDPLRLAALHALANLRGNAKAKEALRTGFGDAERVRYLAAGDRVSTVGKGSGLSAEILAPSRDKQYFSRMDPPSSEHFLAAPGSVDSGIHPFARLEIREQDAEFLDLVGTGQPTVFPADLQDLLDAATLPADRLALALDSYRNNTSLVVLIRAEGKTLLFAGDAQWGNWQSWIGTEKANRILGELDFIKIAHHGSHNATPTSVVKSLRAEGLAAMIPTQVEPFPTIPRMPLLKELGKHCLGGTAVRSDWVEVEKAPKPGGKATFPKRYKPGPLWIDCRL